MSPNPNMEQVMTALREGKKNTALELLKQELSSNPQNVEAMLLVAQTVTEAKEQEKWYRFVLQMEPKNSRALQGLNALSGRTASVFPAPAPTPPVSNSGINPSERQPTTPQPAIQAQSSPQPAVQPGSQHFTPTSAGFPPAASAHNSLATDEQAARQKMPQWGWTAAAWVALLTGFILPLWNGAPLIICGLLIQLGTLAWAIFWAASQTHRRQGLALLVTWAIIQMISFMYQFYFLVNQFLLP